jgi:hypothetical protein
MEGGTAENAHDTMPGRRAQGARTMLLALAASCGKDKNQMLRAGEPLG